MVLGLILRRVGHRKGRAVDHPHVASLPAPGRRDVRFAVACDLERQSPRHTLDHLGPRAAVSAGVGRADRATDQRVERRHAQHRGQTGALFGGKEHLGEHRPECHRRRVDDLIIVATEVDVFGVEGVLDLRGRERVGERQAGGLQQRPAYEVKTSMQAGGRCAKRHETHPSPAWQPGPRRVSLTANDRPSRVSRPRAISDPAVGNRRTRPRKLTRLARATPRCARAPAIDQRQCHSGQAPRRLGASPLFHLRCQKQLTHPGSRGCANRFWQRGGWGPSSAPRCEASSHRAGGRRRTPATLEPEPPESVGAAGSRKVRGAPTDSDGER